MESFCKGCGCCCEAIYTPMGPEVLEYGKGKDVEFIKVHWTHISRAEAIEINPCMSEFPKGHFWTCDQFDKASRHCLVHGTEEKPPVCSNYPLYHSQNLLTLGGEAFYSNACGYKEAYQEAKTKAKEAEQDASVQK